MVSILPLVLSAIFLYFGRKSLKYQILGAILLIVGIGFGSVLHFRWDSFSIHFIKIDTENFNKNKILFIGDSITAEGTRPRGFITKLESLLQVEAQTICEKGATSIQIISLIESNTQNFRPDYIIAQSGINDISEGISTNRIKFRQITLINQLKSSFPSAEIWFLPIHPISTSEKEVNFSFYSPKWWRNSKSFKSEFLLKDGIHLNAKEQTQLATSLAKKLVTPNHSS